MAWKTTVQVSDQTKGLLQKLKNRERARSFDQLIQEMAQEKLGIPESRLGSTPKIAPFSEKERLRLHEL